MIVLSLLPPTAAAGEGEWRYPMQPDDNLWEISERFLVDMKYWDDLVKYNGVERPRHMPPGTVVRIPLQWLRVEPASVKIVALQGEVTHLPARGQARKLTPEAPLQIGDGILVGADGSVLLEFMDGSRTTLGPGTEAYLRRVNRFADSKYGDTVLQIRKGGAETRVPRRGTRFEITTPAANTTVRGTHFRVRSQEATTEPFTEVEVLRGRVRVSNAEGSVTLAEGEGIRVIRDRPPGKPARLLPAPVLEVPRKPIRRLPVELRWKPVRGASRYRALVFGGDDGKLPVVDRTLSRNRMGIEDLPDGHYRLQVRALDSLGLEGRESRAEFVVDARPFAPLAIAPAAGSVVRDPQVSFEWSVPPEADGYIFQLARDAGFLQLQLEKEALENTRMQLEALPAGRYFWRVATRLGDETGPWSTVQSFDLRPAPDAPELETEADDSRLVLRWQPGRPGQRYRVQMAEDWGFSQGLVEQVLDEPRWSLKRPATPVFFRVRVIDTDGYEGAWSPVQKVFPPPEPWYYFGVPAMLIMLLAL